MTEKLEPKLERAQNDRDFLADLGQKFGDIFNAIEANKSALEWPTDEDTAALLKTIKENTVAVGSMLDAGRAALDAKINPMPVPAFLAAGEIVMSKSEVDAMASRIKELERAQKTK